MKKMFIILVVLVLLVCVFTHIVICRLEAIYADKMGKMFALHNTLIVLIPESFLLPDKVLLPPTIMDDKTGASVSWREHVVNFYQGTNNDGKMDYSSLFRSHKDRNDNHTSYVAVVDKQTLWDESIRHKVLQAGFTFDKILLIEIPDTNIPWNSSQDYDIEAAVNLWYREQKLRRSLQGYVNRGSLYITLMGNTGFISDFKTEGEFRNALMLNDKEMLQLESFDQD